MNAKKPSSRDTFLQLCARADGREDHDVLKYVVSTKSILSCYAEGTPPTLLLGMKGVGKSTAFKLLMSSENEKILVGGFAPGAEKFKSLPHVQPGLFRERFYVLFLNAITAIVDGSRAKTSQSVTKQVSSRFKPIGDSIKKQAGRLKGVNIWGFGATFDLSSDQQTALDKFDRDAAESKIREFTDAGVRIRLFIDDPEQALPVGDQGRDSLIGILLAANELNVNFAGRVGITALLKTHVFQSIAGNEELSNVFPSQRAVLTWKPEELLLALDERLKHASARFEELFDLKKEEFLKDVVHFLRNGPRDLFAWIAFAGKSAGNHRIRLKDFAKTMPEVGSFSLRQITSAYSAEVKYIPEMLKSLFPNDGEIASSALLDRITELRTNDSRFIDITKNAPFDRSADYIRFLLEAGCVRVTLRGRGIEPFEQEYFDDTGMRSDTRLALHPLLAATVFKS